MNFSILKQMGLHIPLTHILRSSVADFHEE